MLATAARYEIERRGLDGSEAVRGDSGAGAAAAPRRSRSARRRCRAGGASDLSRDSGAADRGCSAGVAAGSARPVAARARESRRACPRRVSPANGRAAGQHLVQHAAERPDVGALVDRLAARLLGAHVGRGAENHARRVVAGDRDASATCDEVRRRRRSRPATFASPKSSTFTVPSGVILMLAGFRSRWMMPCSCAASSASAICRAIGSASSSGNRTARDAIGERLALDQLHHQAR